MWRCRDLVSGSDVIYGQFKCKITDRHSKLKGCKCRHSRLKLIISSIGGKTSNTIKYKNKTSADSSSCSIKKWENVILKATSCLGNSYSVSIFWIEWWQFREWTCWDFEAAVNLTNFCKNWSSRVADAIIDRLESIRDLTTF